MDATGGVTYIDMGTTQLMSVPYAQYANNGNSAGNNNGDMLYWNGTQWVLIPVGTPGQFLRLSNANVPIWSNLATVVISTTAVSSINALSATSGGNILSDGGGTIIERGVCWSTSPNPTNALSTKTIDGVGIGAYASSVTGLTANTTYYLKAYATNFSGTYYGNEITFTTMDGIIPITTTIPSSVYGASAQSGGNITADGGDPVTVRGVCWSTSPNPTIALSTKTNDGSGIGSYSSSMTGLSPSTTYHVRAYATNNVNTYYGSDEIFTTFSGIVTLTTATVNCVSGINVSGGNILTDGNDPVTARGICWSTSPNPTTADNTNGAGSGLGSFSSNILIVASSTTYYVRSYAINGVNTYYGNQVSFTTPSSIYTIGQSFGGGIIFYIDCSGMHGLIAAPSDQSNGVGWGNGPFVATGATVIGTGQANTTTIVGVLGAGSYAASICDNLTLGGQTDWYLPSRDELILLYQNRAVVGGFVLDRYWSSSEIDDTFSIAISFFSNGGGSQFNYFRNNNTPNERAIRAF